MGLVSVPLMETILFVQDMNSEVCFYRDVLGLSIRYPQGLEDYSGELWVEFESGDCILALHGGAQQKPNHTQEIVFAVDDLEQSRKAIIRAGVKMGEIRKLEDGAFIAQGVDPAGHRFSIRSSKVSPDCLS
jgi:predicted enzyme related to lactoylglutathione lyase